MFEAKFADGILLGLSRLGGIEFTMPVGSNRLLHVSCKKQS